MIIEISKISPGGSRYVGEEPPNVLGLGEERAIRASEPLRYDLTARLVSGEVVLRGRVETRMQLQCGRCAEFFSTLLVDSDFLRDYPLREGQQELDITDDLREAVLLRLPPHPVCGEQCRGLCPRCGKNLNEGPCDCPPQEQPPSDVWRALDHMRLRGGPAFKP